MDAMEAILTRRSVREYSDKPVSEAVVEQLLRAAMQAPSAGNQQPWHFVVARDRALLEAVPTFHPHAQMLCRAPAAILVAVGHAASRPPAQDRFLPDRVHRDRWE